MSKEIKYIDSMSLTLFVGLSLLMIGSLAYNIVQEQHTVENFARIEANASYNKDLLYRRWASMQGGVYVPVSEHTPPNPFLTYIKDRDVSTTDGKELTLVNPAYMTRQVFAIAEKQYRVKGHITSLKPIRPENAPDSWEAEALKQFEQGLKEYSSIEHINGQEYLRYMHAMETESICLKCHAHQGYRLGQIRGGISVSVPLKKYRQVAAIKINNLIISHLIIYVLLLTIGIFGYKRFRNEILRRILMQEKVEENEANLKVQNEEFATLNEEYVTINEELNLTNAELRQARDRAEESDQLKTAFLQNMSHEIRTPLNAICGFSSMLDHENLSSKKRAEFVSIINRSSDNLLAILSNVLTLSTLETRQEKVNFSDVQINELLDDIDKIFKEQAETSGINLIVKTTLSDEKSVIVTDKGKLVQILTNLMSNALKFTHQGFVEFGYKVIKDEHNQSFLEFYVADSGIGIEPEMQKKIFEHFRQANSAIHLKYGGTGLGLAISKSLVQLLDGKMRVYSVPGEGSVFYFTIPYNTGESGEIRNGKEETTPGQKILVAEDEYTNYLLIKEIVEGMGLNIIHAQNGSEAIDMCKSDHTIDLVLMDIRMPVMDGYEATVEIKQVRPKLPIIAQTAYALNNEIQKYGSVFDDYISKPITPEMLRQKISEYLRK